MFTRPQLKCRRKVRNDVFNPLLALQTNKRRRDDSTLKTALFKYLFLNLTKLHSSENIELGCFITEHSIVLNLRTTKVNIFIQSLAY